MYPVYNYPYQTPFTPFNFPSWESPRPQMKEDGANTRPMPEHWPSNYSYPAPMPCQNCCAHGPQPQPSYYSSFTPPCHHFPVPPSYGYYYGGYPAPYPQPYPYVPPPHYSMEMPRYEFDKASPKAFHCCECPNHPSHVKSTSNVKIEEQDPDVETKKTATPSSPYPLMWSPPGYMMNKDQPRRVVEGVEQDPNVRYQWLPLDMNSIKRLMEGGELMKPQEKKNGDEKKSSDVEVEERNKAKRPVEERPPTFKLLSRPDKEFVKEKIESGDDASGAGIQGSRKTGIVKVIPVKQLDDPVREPLKKEQEVELKKSVNNAESVKSGTDMKPSSPAKKSKLPPICLRVDPPRKKNGKGSSSRSPSPPGEKRHQASSDSKEERKDKEAIQVKEVVPNATKEEKGSSTRERQSQAGEQVANISDSSMLNATVSEDNAVPAQESEGVKESEHKEFDAPERKVLSETEAAVVLQSVYRGYAVRRLQPLTKLRCIANVKEEARKVSERVEKLETCANLDDKEKVAIGEMIMNLLLKLDTIQGLHQSVRDVRKSVAKELIRLQEKLDSLVSQVSIPSALSSSAVTGVEQEHTASSSDEQSVGSCEITIEASKTSELGEKEVEEASISEVPLSQDTNQEPPVGSFSEYDVPSSLEKKERELDEIRTPAEGPSTDFKDTQGQFRDKDQEGNLDAEAADEDVENDIQKMEWECDLGAVKTHQEVDREGAEEVSEEMEERIADIASPEEKCDDDVASALEMEKGAEKHGEIIVENDTRTETSGNCYKEQECKHQPSQSNAGTCSEDQNENLNESPQESLEEVEDDIRRMEWECDLGVAKLTPGTDQEVTQLAESRGHEQQSSEVENFEIEDQVDQLVQSDDINAVDTEDCITAELCDEKNTDTRESDTTIGILDMNAQESKVPDMEVSVVEQRQAMPSLEPVVEVEKQIITEIPVSEGIKESNEQIKTGETTRRIIEENEKLRSMVEQLLASGKDQQNVICTLTDKINALEKKLPKRRNKTRSGKRPRVILTRNDSYKSSGSNVASSC